MKEKSPAPNHIRSTQLLQKKIHLFETVIITRYGFFSTLDIAAQESKIVKKQEKPN